MSEDHPFIAHLKGLYTREDRGALAKLRRGLKKSAEEVPEMWPYVVRFLKENASRADRTRHFLLASLFATHPCKTGKPMGNVFRQLNPKDEQPGIERRWVALLNSDLQDLPHHLAAAIQLARGKDVEVDYEQLFEDLKYWDDPERGVQYRWAKQYWGASVEPEAQATKGE